jgi:hypothetical protein
MVQAAHSSKLLLALLRLRSDLDQPADGLGTVRQVGLISGPAIPAKPEAGRKAKVLVCLACVLDWRERHDQVRRLLIDLVGGESADSLRNQFA